MNKLLTSDTDDRSAKISSSDAETLSADKIGYFLDDSAFLTSDVKAVKSTRVNCERDKNLHNHQAVLPEEKDIPQNQLRYVDDPIVSKNISHFTLC